MVLSTVSSDFRADELWLLPPFFLLFLGPFAVDPPDAASFIILFYVGLYLSMFTICLAQY